MRDFLDNITVLESYDAKPMPFDVPPHPNQIAQVAGKAGKTVLTIEQQIFTVRICEYDEPLSYGRFWCYDNVQFAIIALAVYLVTEEATEPKGWQRAVDRVEGFGRERRFVKSNTSAEEFWQSLQSPESD